MVGASGAAARGSLVRVHAGETYTLLRALARSSLRSLFSRPWTPRSRCEGARLRPPPPARALRPFCSIGVRFNPLANSDQQPHFQQQGFAFVVGAVLRFRAFCTARTSCTFTSLLEASCFLIGCVTLFDHSTISYAQRRTVFAGD